MEGKQTSIGRPDQRINKLKDIDLRPPRSMRASQPGSKQEKCQGLADAQIMLWEQQHEADTKHSNHNQATPPRHAPQAKRHHGHGHGLPIRRGLRSQHHSVVRTRSVVSCQGREDVSVGARMLPPSAIRR